MPSNALLTVAYIMLARSRGCKVCSFVSQCHLPELLPETKHIWCASLSFDIARPMYARSKEYKVALRWLSWLLTERRDDPGLWSIVGYVQLMLGDISVADRTFHKAAELLSAAQTPQQNKRNQAIVRRHQGLLLFARNDFAGQSHCLLHSESLPWSVFAHTDAYPAHLGLLLGFLTPCVEFAVMCFLLSCPSRLADVALSTLSYAAASLYLVYSGTSCHGLTIRLAVMSQSSV